MERWRLGEGVPARSLARSEIDGPGNLDGRTGLAPQVHFDPARLPCPAREVSLEVISYQLDLLNALFDLTKSGFSGLSLCYALVVDA